MIAVVGELGIDLVADEEEVVVDQDIGDCAPICLRHHPAGGVVREVCYQNLRPGSDTLHERIGRQPELVLRPAGHGHRDTAGEGDTRGVGDVARFCHQHLVARVGDGADGDIGRLRDAAGHDDLLVGIVACPKAGIEVAADSPAELGRPLVRCIGGRPLLDGVDGRLTDAPGGHEVRFADAQGYDVLHRLGDIEELPDARRRYGTHPCRDEISQRTSPQNE
ncbi:MAG: hypothetical protein BWX50_01081 [Euryarchaeota archaeon ADurb.Bin009]|nr:MAG: hypothetical protein BWX50_01081 [Euryarchaeota archaeon ADurb.Bin009]